jgi:hypothetical protein
VETEPQRAVKAAVEADPVVAVEADPETAVEPAVDTAAETGGTEFLSHEQSLT